MTTITATEAARLLATHPEIMEWELRDNGFIDPSEFDECDIVDDRRYTKKEGECYWFACKYSDWQPLKDKNQIFQCLEVFTSNAGYTISKSSRLDYGELYTRGQKEYSIYVVSFLDIERYHINLNHAIALALIEAVTGTKYTEITED